MKWIFLFLCTILFPIHGQYLEKRVYDLHDHPIDVVIPCVAKDLEVLEQCIQGAKNNFEGIRRIIVVSPERYTNSAEWYDEAEFPFSIRDIAEELVSNKKEALVFLKNGERAGWYFQQLLKLYAPLVIPGISSNVVVLDADTIFLKPVKFLNNKNGGLYGIGREYHLPYFKHMNRLIPGLSKVYPQYSGVCHHMLLQRDVIQQLFHTIETIYQKEAWKAFCNLVDPATLPFSGMSEYEIYFNFIFTTSDQMSIRPLRFQNISRLSEVKKYKRQGYDFVSCHSYSRQ